MNFSLHQILELVSIVTAGTMVGNELAIAVFVHPRLSRLDDVSHVRAVQPLAAVLGAVMPFWYAFTLITALAVAFLARPAGTPGHGLALAAADLFGVMIVYTVLLPVPINNQVARWKPEALPANWRELRRRWDRLHAFRVVVLAIAFILLVAACVTPLNAVVPIPDLAAGPPKRVTIEGYDGDAMEPFITRDGRYLLFNSFDEPGVKKDIHFAERKDDFTWVYRGAVDGINSPDVDGCPTLDRNGKIFFVSPRAYPKTLCTIYTGAFKDGKVTDVQLVESISRKEAGIVNFDVEVTPDGKTLYFVDSKFRPILGPQTADFVIADWDGARFTRRPDSAQIMAQVNKSGALQYAATISADDLTLYFTRFDRASGFVAPQIYRSTRASAKSPFDTPLHIKGLGEFVEGTAFSPDERLLYYHRQDQDSKKKKFNLYAVPVP